jgi:hypothetical protein
MRSGDFTGPGRARRMRDMIERQELAKRRADIARVLLAIALLAGVAAFNDAQRAGTGAVPVAVNQP